MGVLRQGPKRVGFSDDDSNSDLGGDPIQTSSSEDEDPVPVIAVPPPTVPTPRRQQQRPPPSPATPRRATAGHKLCLKKGRRSRHRYENERRLFSTYCDQAEPEEAPEGWDIAPETKSYFTALLDEDNEEVLDNFINNREGQLNENKRQRNGGKGVSLEEDFDPERAFLNISSNLRNAMKKHLPWGMLEGLENDITDFFSIQPDAVYIVGGLSSFERLLAHACSAYNFLQSNSIDIGGERKLKIENPGVSFNPKDPSLTSYLQRRMGCGIRV